MLMISRWISGVLGLVVVVIPFLTLSESALTWTLVIVGVVIAFSSFWALLFEAAEEGRTHGA